MTFQIIHHSDLMDRRVINQQTAEEVGRIAEIWLEPKSHQILGFSCKSGLLGMQRQAFTWAQVDSIGDTGVIVSALGGISVEKPDAVEAIVGGEVWTESGDLRGTLSDYRIDLETGDVLDYLFVSDGILGGLADGVYRLPTEAVVSMTNRRIIAKTAAVQNAELIAEGLTHKLNQAADFLKQDYVRTKQDVSSMLQGTQAIAQQLNVARQKATERLTDLTESLHDRTQQAPGQPRLESTPIAGQLPGASEETADSPEQPQDSDPRT